MSEFFSKLKMFFAEADKSPAALLAGEVLGWVIVGSIWGIGWAGFFLVRNYTRSTAVAAISCGVLILVLVAWRSLKADIEPLDDPGSNPLMGKRREDRSNRTGYPLASQAQARITHSLPPNS
jgi:hypothetical protein